MDSEWNWQAAAVLTPLTSAGDAAVNHAQPSEATKLYISRLDDSDHDRSAIFERLTRHDTVYLQAKGQALSWHRYEVTGRPSRTTECWIIPVKTRCGSSQGTEPGNNTPIIVSIPGDA